MGLFGSKKEALSVKVADLFTEEQIAKIQSIVKEKVDSKGYQFKYMDMAKTLLEYTKDPEKIFSGRELAGLIYSAGAMTKLEPGIADILNSAIEKYHSIKKAK